MVLLPYLYSLLLDIGSGHAVEPLQGSAFPTPTQGGATLTLGYVVEPLRGNCILNAIYCAVAAYSIQAYIGGVDCTTIAISISYESIPTSHARNSDRNR